MKEGSVAVSPKWVIVLSVGILCFGLGMWIRLDAIEHRPLHADEATGARLLADRLETGTYAFDPTHFHGPLLSAFAEPVARLRGEADWESLSPRALRLGIAWLGGLTVLLALAFAPWIGIAGALAAGAFVATSPFLVYYSRVFIHETLFGFLAIGTVLALVAYLNGPALWKAVVLGILAGLLMATRETFVICFFAWAVAGALVAFEHHRRGRPLVPGPVVLRLPRDVLLAAALAFLVVSVLYTGAGSSPAGLVDFVRTFFVYETGEGHDKPFWHYAWMLLWPKQQGGVWWTEAAIGAGAILGFALSFKRPRGDYVRFLFYAGIVQWIVYSVIPYKTPWLVLTPWLHFCLVAGAGVGYLFGGGGIARKGAVLAVVVALLVWHKGQADRATHRYASDTRNPYAYVPTSTDIERAPALIAEMARVSPDVEAGPVAVIGRAYWPLPWYLRGTPSVGYWDSLPEDAQRFPVLLVLPAELARVRESLDDTHTALPRGLRADTPVFLLVRNDIWEAYLDFDDE